MMTALLGDAKTSLHRLPLASSDYDVYEMDIKCAYCQALPFVCVVVGWSLEKGSKRESYPLWIPK